MKRGRAKRVLVFAMGAALALAAGAPGEAQLAISPMARTDAELEALDLLEADRPIAARAAAERILRRNPSSVVGHYVFGRVLADSEGALGRGLHHLGRARELYEREGPAGMAGPAPELHRELLYRTAQMAGQMELYEFQLELLGYHDYLYDPDLVAERAWPLIKLGRLEEARTFAATAASSSDFWQRTLGLNALCAVEGEARERERYRDACVRAFELARASRDRGGGRSPSDAPQPITVSAYNAALATAATLNIEEAERIALEGARRLEPTPANPWRLLVELRLSQGQHGAAFDALAETIRWYERQPASMRDHARAELEATVALALLVGGELEGARLRIDRAIARPDRRGLTTEGAVLARARHAVIRRMIRRAERESRAEEASLEGYGARVGAALASSPERLTDWTDGERVRTALSDNDVLIGSVRPMLPGGMVRLSPWLAGELIDILGPTIVAVAIARARAQDIQSPGALAWLAALDAEVAAARGDGSEAVRKVRMAVAGLGDAHGATLARAAARAAAAAESDGMRAVAFDLYAEALGRDAGVLRRLGLSLPAEVRSVGPVSGEAAERLSRSPRLRSERGAFVIALDDIAGGARACLNNARGNQISCVQVMEAPPDSADRDGATPEPLSLRLARAVHEELLGTRVPLSSLDLSSLDGSTISGARAARDRLREILGSE